MKKVFWGLLIVGILTGTILIGRAIQKGETQSTDLDLSTEVVDKNKLDEIKEENKEESTDEKEEAHETLTQEEPTTQEEVDSLLPTDPPVVVTPQPTPIKTPKPTPKPTPTPTPGPWEKFGVSEYDYYHKPMWSWQSVTFELNGKGKNACSSESDCRKKCIEYGDAYIEQNPGGYRCDMVNSYSGDYLGEYFEYFEVQ